MERIKINNKIDFYLGESAYPGNIGFKEMVVFYQKASKEQINQMEKIIAGNDWNKFKELIKKVLGVILF
jgi:hypothetical protein